MKGSQSGYFVRAKEDEEGQTVISKPDVSFRVDRDVVA